MTALIESPVGTVFVSVHAYDRAERHGIDTDYVGDLLGDVQVWEPQGERVFADIERDGVLWRVVMEPEPDDGLKHDWDVVTVTPTDVDMDVATDALGETTALNLALYCN